MKIVFKCIDGNYVLNDSQISSLKDHYYFKNLLNANFIESKKETCYLNFDNITYDSIYKAINILIDNTLHQKEYEIMSLDELKEIYTILDFYCHTDNYLEAWLDFKLYYNKKDNTFIENIQSYINLSKATSWDILIWTLMFGVVMNNDKTTKCIYNKENLMDKYDIAINFKIMPKINPISFILDGDDICVDYHYDCNYENATFALQTTSHKKYSFDVKSIKNDSFLFIERKPSYIIKDICIENDYNEEAIIVLVIDDFEIELNDISNKATYDHLPFFSKEWTVPRCTSSYISINRSVEIRKPLFEVNSTTNENIITLKLASQSTDVIFVTIKFQIMKVNKLCKILDNDNHALHK